MKKTIAILMCVLMLAGATIACFADTQTPAKAAGPLAITELNNAPEEESGSISRSLIQAARL